MDYTVPKFFRFVLQAGDKYNNILNISTIGHTGENRPVLMAYLSLPNKKPGKNPVAQDPNRVFKNRPKQAVFIECGIHSSEWISPAFCLYVINRLISMEHNGPLEHFDFYVIPVLNPDGLHYSWSNLR